MSKLASGSASAQQLHDGGVERGEGVGATAGRVARAIVVAAFAAALFDLYRRQGIGACAVAFAAVLVVYAGMWNLKRMTRTDTFEHLLAAYPAGVSNPRTRVRWSMAIGTFVSALPIVAGVWIFAENISAERLLPVMGVALVLMMLLGIAITAGGVAYAIWYLIHTRNATP